MRVTWLYDGAVLNLWVWTLELLDLIDRESESVH